jgi:cytochrome P450
LSSDGAEHDQRRKLVAHRLLPRRREARSTAWRISHLHCSLMVDYIGPSLDTTISAIPNAMHLFAAHSEQLQLLKEDPSLIPNAVNEIVRYESSLRAFCRQACHDTPTSPAHRSPGARILVNNIIRRHERLPLKLIAA